jgi:hypothetical protein
MTKSKTNTLKKEGYKIAQQCQIMHDIELQYGKVRVAKERAVVKTKDL